MSKFKKGDRVKVTDDGTCFNIGDALIVDENSSHMPWCLNLSSTKRWAVDEDRIELLTEDKIKVGDTLVDPAGREFIVLVVLDRDSGLYALSEYGNHNAFGSWVTNQDLIDRGLASPKKEESIIEKTVAELEADLSLPAGTLRIKKG